MGLLWAIAGGIAFAASPTSGLDGRFIVASELLLPRPQAFRPERGDGFETRSWQVHALVRCSASGAVTRCTVDDAALQASAFVVNPPHDPREVARTLDELAQSMRGITLVATVSERGRLRRWSTEGRPAGTAQQTQAGMLLELTLERALAGLWVERPNTPVVVGSQWVETNHSPAFSFPRIGGEFALGTSTVLHQVAAVGDEIVADCVDEGAMADQGEQLKAAGRCRTTWTAGWALRSREWTVDGTAIDVVRYHHAGWIRRLTDEEVAPALGPNRHVRAPGEPPEADVPGLPAWPDLDPITP